MNPMTDRAPYRPIVQAATFGFEIQPTQI
jgi:hypothetical protein